jgi:S-adenosylmethionine:tRNA ribosyltransferase-isomerase
MLSTALFDYPIPPELVAQTPAERRDRSRLIVVDRAAHAVSHHAFSDLPLFLRAGDVLFRNNAAVLPARLKALRPGGGRVECLLLSPAGNDRLWRCLVKPGRKLPAGATFAGAGGAFRGEVVSQGTDGTVVVQFETRDNAPMTAIAHQFGEIPLPPYIRRTGGSTREYDRLRYQTVYADPERPVAVAAPTAGLHFTPELLAVLAAQGVGSADLTLHVGLGTFRPIAAATVESHAIHSEAYEIPVSTQRALFPDPAAGTGRRVAVGTTTVRSIEDFLAVSSGPGDGPHVADAGIFIYPPRIFRGVDALITNFHQPRSTLLCLVAAFLTPGSADGIAWLGEIYAEAVARRYRFFSYGDAMLIL